MEEILHHLGSLNTCNSYYCKDFKWCKISSINCKTIAQIDLDGVEDVTRFLGLYHSRSESTAWMHVSEYAKQCGAKRHSLMLRLKVKYAKQTIDLLNPKP